MSTSTNLATYSDEPAFEHPEDFRRTTDGPSGGWVCTVCPEKQWDDTQMPLDEILRHEKEKRHQKKRKEINRPRVPRGRKSSTNDVWGSKTGLNALENRKYEGSLITMPTRVASWMRGVQLATSSRNEDGEVWRMEDDYQVEEYPPLEEWTQGWAETWAMSVSGSNSTEDNEESEEELGRSGSSPSDQEFLQNMIKLKRPNNRLKALWVEFVQLPTAEKIERIQKLVMEIRNQSPVRRV